MGAFVGALGLAAGTEAVVGRQTFPEFYDGRPGSGWCRPPMP